MQKPTLLSPSRLFPGLFLIVRFIMLMGMPLETWRGYGDYWNFYRLASLGWPFRDYWVEFPPIFPVIASFIYQLVGGRQHVFEIILALGLSVVQAGNLWLFFQLARRTRWQTETDVRTWVYFALLVGLFYGWGYFDSLVVFTILVGVYLLALDRPRGAGFVLGLGILTKWFPVLSIPALWRLLSSRRALYITLLALGMAVIIWGGLYLAFPQMTAASLHSQFGRGSWETVWALAQGNLRTGNLGLEVDHLDPQTAYLQSGESQGVPSWMSLMPFLIVGGILFTRARATDWHSAISFMGLTWCLFLLWSPGWSPQWVLYLLPLILLVLPLQRAILLSLTLVVISLAEWPLFLSRGLFSSLWWLVPMRTGLILLLAVLFWYAMREISTEAFVE
jgi:hypothetical protein